MGAEGRRIRADMPWDGLLTRKQEDEIRIQLDWLIRIYRKAKIYVLYSTLLHLPFPADFYCVRRMLGSNPGLLRLWNRQSDALTARLDLIHIRKAKMTLNILLLKFLCYEDLYLFFEGFYWRLKILHGGLDKKKYRVHWNFYYQRIRNLALSTQTFVAKICKRFCRRAVDNYP
jgi:hypothetical protein